MLRWNIKKERISSYVKSLKDGSNLTWGVNDSDYNVFCFRQQLYDYANHILDRISEKEMETGKPFGVLKLFFLGSGGGLAEYCFCELLRLLGVDIDVYFEKPDYPKVTYLTSISKILNHVNRNQNFLFIGLNFNYVTSFSRIDKNFIYRIIDETTDLLELMRSSDHNIKMTFSFNKKYQFIQNLWMN